jgi:FlaA1/EpsC-like NDP-sugar epimerase
MNKTTITKALQEITGRKENLFQDDLIKHKSEIASRVNNKSVLVIGGAGSIGSQFIQQLLHFKIKRLYVIDVSENGLAELVRDVRSSDYESLPEIKTYPIDFSSDIFKKIWRNEGPFDIVANFAAHKHVRSEKDEYAIEAMFKNNFINAYKLLKLLDENPPESFFCVSTDKATNPVSIMGATKKIMEDIIFSYKNKFKITTARFANVAFSNGSLLNSYINRYEKKQPIVCPKDINRYFVTPVESGTLCLLACVLGKTGETFVPQLSAENDLIPMRKTVGAFFDALEKDVDYCSNEQEAKEKATLLQQGKQEKYPVYLFDTNTSGEKAYEEFFSEDDEIIYNRFSMINVIKPDLNGQASPQKILKGANDLFDQHVTKERIVDFLNKQIPEFAYIDKGMSLDQKM